MYSLLKLVQVWSFDEGKGTEANDSSKKGHTATTVGKVEWDTGKIGQAAKFAPVLILRLSIAPCSISVYSPLRSGLSFLKIPVVESKI